MREFFSILVTRVILMLMDVSTLALSLVLAG
jgi:hypothetical protein